MHILSKNYELFMSSFIGYFDYFPWTIQEICFHQLRFSLRGLPNKKRCRFLQGSRCNQTRK